MKENNNKGFTLLELVVVMAIMMIVLGLTATGFAMIGRTKVKSATKTIESRMDELRQTSMARDGEWWAEITYSDEKYFMSVKYKETVTNQQGISTTTEKTDSYEELGNGMKIYFKDGDGLEQDITTDGLYIKFNKKDGSVASVLNKDGNSYITSSSKSGQIIVINNKEQSYIVTIYYKTGQIDCN